MNEKEFDNLIKRCLSGQATKEEIESVEEWLNQRGETDLFNKLSSRQKEDARVSTFRRLSARMKELPGPVGKGKANVKTTKVWAAAAVILLAAFGYVLRQVSADSPSSEQLTIIHSVTSTGVSKKIILSDSSIVWVKGNSSISYPERFSGTTRNIQLVGEALFEIARDPKRPFVIQCGDLTAKVLGTSFNIKTTEKDIEVIVLTGRVELSSREGSDPMIVHPNERVVYTQADQAMEKFAANEVQRNAKIAGTEYGMRFNATRLDEIVRRIETKFDVEVELSDARLGNCTITADFTDQPLDRTLDMIAQTLEIEYEIGNNRVTLKGDGCG